MSKISFQRDTGLHVEFNFFHHLYLRFITVNPLYMLSQFLLEYLHTFYIAFLFTFLYNVYCTMVQRTTSMHCTTTYKYTIFWLVHIQETTVYHDYINLTNGKRQLNTSLPMPHNISTNIPGSLTTIREGSTTQECSKQNTSANPTCSSHYCMHCKTGYVVSMNPNQNSVIILWVANRALTRI